VLSCEKFKQVDKSIVKSDTSEQNQDCEHLVNVYSLVIEQPVLVVELDSLLVLLGQQMVFENVYFELEGSAEFNPLQQYVV